MGIISNRISYLILLSGQIFFIIEEKEKELIKKALEKNHGKRKLAAKDLGISERTLYRKLKEYDIENF